MAEGHLIQNKTGILGKGVLNPCPHYSSNPDSIGVDGNVATRTNSSGDPQSPCLIQGERIKAEFFNPFHQDTKIVMRHTISSRHTIRC